MNLTTFLIVFLQVDIDKKLENAPNDGYQIGIVIGTYLPFVLLVVLAYIIYYRMKNRKDYDE